MIIKLTAVICAIAITLSLSSCSWNREPEALSGVAPPIVDASPDVLLPGDSFHYESALSLSESFKQLSSLRLCISDLMYSAVYGFTDSSAWVPAAAISYALGCDEFLAASYVDEIEPNTTAKQLFEEQGFENVTITPLDIENTWEIKAFKNEGGVQNTYEYTVMYGDQSDSYRFSLKVNMVPTLLLASRRISGGYAIQVWTPEGMYNILVHDVKEGRLGFVPNTDKTKFPESDIYFSSGLITNSFTTARAEYTFLLANNILYVSKGGSNYAIPLP